MFEFMVAFLIGFAFIFVIAWTCRPSCRKCRSKVRKGASICPSCRSELGEGDLLPGASASLYLFIGAGIAFFVALSGLSMQNDDLFVVGLIGAVGLVCWATRSLLQEIREKNPESALVAPLGPWARKSASPSQDTPVASPPAPGSPPDVPAFAWQGSKAYCTKCRTTADIQEEMGERRVVCVTCGRSESARKVLR